ncbi:dynamin GTPase [Xylariaceae sp. FL1272]|nr:dynamin GTPase [Xylariaceae sp. FL1272]
MKSSKSSLMDSDLLHKIDRLFACNVGDYVDLPQLVVVGLQSSGKSSVLEGLTDLPFPRDSGLCTRFATQIYFRRSKIKSIVASIVPAKDASEEHQADAKAWRKELEELDASSFSTIMREAATVMGVGSNHSPGQQPAFSEDVLMLEIADPSQEHFSVIDVPGTFKKQTEGVTTKEDIKIVDRMVRGYMTNPRSVMLTIVSANSDIANEGIVQQAEDLDPDGIRTLGVLTKPDLVDKGAEGKVIELVEGKRHRLRLGWHVVRNLGQAELDQQTESRQAKEDEFFKIQAPWDTLDKDKVGVSSLRRRLQEILAMHIRREFPKVRSDINQKIKHVEEQLKYLGHKRQTREEQIQFLMEIASNFQNTASAAARADYGQSSHFDDNTMRLATLAVNRAEEFAALIRESGHRYAFDNSDTQGDISILPPMPSDTDTDMEEPDHDDAHCPLSTRHVADHADVEDMLHDLESVISAPQDNNILPWLKSVYSHSRGYEIGTFDDKLLAVAMRAQAANWNDVAMGYISDMIAMVHTFLSRLLELTVANERTRQGIMDLLIDDLRARYQLALQRTAFLIQVELAGKPATLNHYFNDNLSKCRQERIKRQLRHKTLENCKHGSDVVRLDDIAQTHNMGNVDHVIYEIHDILRSYYKVALKRFVDNVRMQVADHTLVNGPHTPLQLFCPTFVAGMTDEQLEEVAGEEPGVRRRRDALEKELGLLKQGKRILQ